MIKKADIILAAALIVIGMLSSYVLAFDQGNGNEVEITTDGQLFGTYPLSEDRQITVEQNSHINKITIKDGSVSMSFSDCSGQGLCGSRSRLKKRGDDSLSSKQSDSGDNGLAK